MKSLTYALKHEWYNILLILISFLILPFIWDQMPDQIPTRWNLQGEVTAYGSKAMGLLIMPSVNLIVYLILLYLPIIDPKKRIKIDQKPIPVLRTLTVVLLVALHGWIIMNSMSSEPQTQSWLLLGLSIFFLVMGNYLRTIEPNYFIGIRVPWALEDAENWRKTHKIGSYVWVAGGLLLLLLFPFVGSQTYGTIFGVVAAFLAIIPAGYSFYIYKQAGSS